MNGKFTLVFNGRGEKAKCPANPKFPNGMIVDLAGNKKGCVVQLPYPAPEVGLWHITCNQCSLTAALTAAGRTDDPKVVIIPCKALEATKDT